jgi:hypothetical protein
MEQTNLVYEYGVRLDKKTIAAVNDQIAKSRVLYNNLVAMIRVIVTDLQAYVLDQAGDVAKAVYTEIKLLNEQFAAAKESDDEPAMKIIAQERRIKWRELAELLKEARIANKDKIQSRFLSRIGKNSTCETYKVRTKAVEDGLGWATANVILDSALIAWKKSFALGRPPRFSIGSEKTQDSLSLQFTLAGGVPVATLLSGKHGDLALTSNDCGKRKYGELKFRLGAAKQGVYATGTWQYHRPIPESAHIGLARLVRHRVGNDIKWAIQLQTKVNHRPAEYNDRKPLVTVHFGWASDVTGRQVAGIADSADPESALILQLPVQIETMLGHANDLQAQRDKLHDEIVPKFKEIVLQDGLDQSIIDEFLAIKKLPTRHIATRRLHWFCFSMRHAGMCLPEWLEEWRKKDKILHQSAAHIALRARHMRRDFYRTTASDLSKNYSAIAIEPLDLKEAALKVNQVTGEKSDLNKKARHGRVVAALYEFESAIRWASIKNGSALIDVVTKTVTHCGICGADQIEGQNQVLQCKHCGAEIDRKKNCAAVAYRHVYEQYEDVVANYWLDRSASIEKKQLTKLAKLTKMADGRRKAKNTENESRNENDQ